MGMLLSNFVPTHTKGKDALDLEYFADISVTTGALWWKKTEVRKIRKEFGGAWHFVDTGEFTPGYVVDNLERAHKASLALSEARPL